METKSKKAKSSFLNLGSNLGKSKLLQGVVTLAGIVLYLLARKSKNKIRHTFLLILVCTMGVASFSCGNKSQKKVDLNKALDNAIERVEDEADKLDKTWDDTKKETRKEAEKVKHEIEKIQK